LNSFASIWHTNNLSLNNDFINNHTIKIVNQRFCYKRFPKTLSKIIDSDITTESWSRSQNRFVHTKQNYFSNSLGRYTYSYFFVCAIFFLWSYNHYITILSIRRRNSKPARWYYSQGDEWAEWVSTFAIKSAHIFYSLRMWTILIVPWCRTFKISSNTKAYASKHAFVTLWIRSTASKQSLSQIKFI